MLFCENGIMWLHSDWCFRTKNLVLRELEKGLGQVGEHKLKWNICHCLRLKEEKATLLLHKVYHWDLKFNKVLRKFTNLPPPLSLCFIMSFHLHLLLHLPYSPWPSHKRCMCSREKNFTCHFFTVTIDCQYGSITIHTHASSVLFVVISYACIDTSSISCGNCNSVHP